MPKLFHLNLDISLVIFNYYNFEPNTRQIGRYHRTQLENLFVPLIQTTQNLLRSKNHQNEFLCLQ